jgi:hypothetical protein
VHNQACLKAGATSAYNTEWAREGAPLLWATDNITTILNWHGFESSINCRYGEDEADFGRYPKSLKWILNA